MALEKSKKSSHEERKPLNEELKPGVSERNDLINLLRVNQGELQENGEKPLLNDEQKIAYTVQAIKNFTNFD